MTSQAPDAVRSAIDAVRGISDDYQTSEVHHPHHVLIPIGKFEQLQAAEASLAALDSPAVDAVKALTETVRLAVWNAAKKKGISDEAALATVEAVIAELPTTAGQTTVPPLT